MLRRLPTISFRLLQLSHEPGDRRVQGLPSREDWEREVAINHNQTGDRKKDLLQQQVRRQSLVIPPPPRPSQKDHYAHQFVI